VVIAQSDTALVSSVTAPLRANALPASAVSAEALVALVESHRFRRTSAYLFLECWNNAGNFRCRESHWKKLFTSPFSIANPGIRSL
jgi:hypothetical protein